MIGELDIAGVFLPAVFPLAALALIITLMARAVLRRVRFYRLVWHAGLFDVAMFVLALWALALATRQVTP